MPLPTVRSLVACLALAALPAAAAVPPPNLAYAPLPPGLYAEFTTPHGAIVAELDHRRAPLTVMSFVGRAEGTLAQFRGRPLYAGLKWYRVVPDFVVQSGNPARSLPQPTAADVEEGSPLPFPDEFGPGLGHDGPGVLSMANIGPDTNRADFFITLRASRRLDYLHPVFGRVVRGGELLARIQPDETFDVRIVRVGPEAEAYRAEPAAFAALVAAQPKYAAATEPGPTAHFDDPDRLLPQEIPRAQHFNFKLANFEHATGRKVYARVFKSFVPAREGQALGAFHRELAQRLGVEADGVLVSYFADLDQWMVWIGEPLLPAFMGRAGTRDEFMAGDGLMRRKEEFLAAALARGASIAGSRPPKDPQRLKLQCDEVLDDLIALLRPAR